MVRYFLQVIFKNIILIFGFKIKDLDGDGDMDLDSDFEDDVDEVAAQQKHTLTVLQILTERRDRVRF